MCHIGGQHYLASEWNKRLEIELTQPEAIDFENTDDDIIMTMTFSNRSKICMEWFPNAVEIKIIMRHPWMKQTKCRNAGSGS